MRPSLLLAIVLALSALGGVAHAQHRDPRTPAVQPPPPPSMPAAKKLAVWALEICAGYDVFVGKDRDCCVLCMLGADPLKQEPNAIYYVGSIGGISDKFDVGDAGGSGGDAAKADAGKGDGKDKDKDKPDATTARAKRRPAVEGLSGLASPTLGGLRR